MPFRRSQELLGFDTATLTCEDQRYSSSDFTSPIIDMAKLFRTAVFRSYILQAFYISVFDGATI